MHSHAAPFVAISLHEKPNGDSEHNTRVRQYNTLCQYEFLSLSPCLFFLAGVVFFSTVRSAHRDEGKLAMKAPSLRLCQLTTALTPRPTPIPGPYLPTRMLPSDSSDADSAERSGRHGPAIQQSALFTIFFSPTCHSRDKFLCAFHDVM